MIKLKSEREIHLMRQAGAVAAQAMELVGKSIRPGMTTQEVDDIFCTMSGPVAARLPSITMVDFRTYLYFYQ